MAGLRQPYTCSNLVKVVVWYVTFQNHPMYIQVLRSLQGGMTAMLIFQWSQLFTDSRYWTHKNKTFTYNGINIIKSTNHTTRQIKYYTSSGKNTYLQFLSLVSTHLFRKIVLPYPKYTKVQKREPLYSNIGAWS